MGSESGRASYLLDGRRVRVRDLLDAGLIQAHDRLTFTRPRFGETHTAFVEPSGSLRIDGQTCGTPSAAARAAARASTHSGQFDGWIAWTTDTGVTLHALRQQLLDDVAAEAASRPVDDDGEDGSESLLPRHEFLKQAREAAERGQPKTITVRDLVRHWGASSRGSQVSLRISADLDNHGLSTDPDFLSVTLDDEVILTAAQPEESKEDGDTPPITDTVAENVIPIVRRGHREIGLTLGNLIKPGRTLEWVKPTATVEEAMTKMLVNDYSQLAVLKSKYNLEGAVTWQSIAQARLKDPAAPLAAAVVPATRFSFSDDLNNVLPRLQDENFVVVANHHNEITGIVTTADVVALYQQRTLPFLLIGELDQELRRLIEETIPFDTVRDVCAQEGRPELTSFDDMTMGDYQQVLANTECWMVLGWPLDRGTFVRRVDELRRVRNDITHFNPDPAPDDTVDKLRHMLSVIRMFGPSDDS